MRAVVFLLLLASGVTYAGSTADFFAQGAYTGMQLSVADAEKQGKIPSAAAFCLKALKYSQLVPVIESLLRTSLTADELAKSDAFYSSGAGQKNAKQGLLQIYAAKGHTPPEAMPAFTAKERSEIDTFSITKAGTKLFKERVLETPPARKAISDKIQEMVQSCRPR